MCDLMKGWLGLILFVLFLPENQWRLSSGHRYSKSSFPVLHEVVKVNMFVLLKFKDKIDGEISNFN